MGARKNQVFYYTQDMNKESYDLVVEGMSYCHDVAFNVLDDVQKSIEEVQAILMTGHVSEKDVQLINQFNFAVNTLLHLKDRIQGDYFDKIDSLKKDVIE